MDREAAEAGAVLLAVIVASLLGLRAWDSQRGEPLEIWHTHIPNELGVAEIDRADWAGYLRREEAIFADLRSEVTQKLDPEDRVPINRYFDGSPVYTGRFAQDWNRSYILEPDGPPVGAAVFLHGLTDSPYSLRHVARRYRERGFVTVAVRLPGHGTVPAGLTAAEWPDWMAATRLAVREAKRRAGPGAPLQVIGFSTGGALAMMYALDALEDPKLARPDRLVLISPMIGITEFARFAGVAGWPAVFPAFAKAAWIAVLPEFNPFKYNSFPIQGALQSHALATTLQSRIQRTSRAGKLAGIAPVLTFQSVIDFTVSTRAVIASLYAQLPVNGSELVLFDLNRDTKFGPLVRTSFETLLARLLPDPPRNYRTTVVTNEGSTTGEVLELSTDAGQTDQRSRPLGLRFPRDIYSLSHVALPFPPEDSLYGINPDPAEDFGINLGAMAARGERGMLIVSLDALLRMSSNLFFPYMLERIDEGIAPAARR